MGEAAFASIILLQNQTTKRDLSLSQAFPPTVFCSWEEDIALTAHRRVPFDFNWAQETLLAKRTQRQTANPVDFFIL